MIKFRQRVRAGRTGLLLLALTVAIGALGVGASGAAAAGTSGAVFTTNAACTGTNVNIFGSKDAVYLDGGPAHPGAAGLPDGNYYVQVTAPDGTVLGTSLPNTPAHVTGGSFDQCYQLSAILTKASDASAGYDDTSNPGGEYKVWVSQDPTFSSGTKTDNFKVKSPGDGGHLPQGTLNVVKYYDANTNGVEDAGEAELTGWMFNIHDGINWDRFTPVSMVLDPDTYVLKEYQPFQTNWIQTDPGPSNPTREVTITLGDGDTDSVAFGNVCTGAGGGLTLGFWSNKNGQALYNAAALAGLSLRNANGSLFTDASNYSKFRTWILNATATNMAYMLSAQLAAMELNVYTHKVSASSLVYAPGATSANAAGFATVGNLMAEANTELGLHGSTPSGSPYRGYQEALKNALDAANNNQNFAQATPCAFTF
jgi:hypothetical protein